MLQFVSSCLFSLKTTQTPTQAAANKYSNNNRGKKELIVSDSKFRYSGENKQKKEKEGKLTTINPYIVYANIHIHKLYIRMLSYFDVKTKNTTFPVNQPHAQCTLF